MDANIEKYRGLANVIKTNTKRDILLFGPTGIFGDPEKNPKPFELFRKWLLKITRIDKNQIGQDTITEQKFVDFLRTNQEKDENKELIRKIEELHTDNIIEDKSENKNILLKFAKALNYLGIINDPEESYLNNYRVAIRTARQLEPLKDQKADKKEVSKTETKVPNTSKVPTDSKKEEVKEGKGTESTSFGSTGSVSSGSTSTGESVNSASKEDENEAVNINGIIKAKSTNTETTLANKEPTTDKKEPEIEKIKPIIQPVNLAPNLAPLNDGKNEIKIKKDKLEESKFESTNLKVEREQGGLIVTGDVVIERNIEQNTPNTPKGTRRISRITGSNGQVMRSAKINKGPLRVEDTKNSQDAPENDYQSNSVGSETARRQQIIENQQEEPKKKGLVGKLVKRGAIGVAAGGTFFGFVLNGEDSTADAATFIATHSISTFKSIISLIHLFIK
ncbi:MAG: hypothetical protein NTZ25_00605 [Candidatus Peregrinibacteria bacterium]|nr:hypothetical protein [Candidatus Peregrinibacteria bacterium]